MDFGIYLTGACGQSQELYKARNEVKRGRAPNEIVQEQIIKDTKTVIEHQQQADCSFCIDPSFEQYYLFQPLVEHVPGISCGPQENWFNNNQFYWRPQIKGPLIAKNISTYPSFFSKYLHPSFLLAEKTMVILPSPYTLLQLSDGSGYPDQRSAIRDLSRLISKEARCLVETYHVTRIQFDEPAFVVKQNLGSLTKEDFSLLEEAMGFCGTISGATTVLQTYFGDAGSLLGYFKSLPVDGIGIDGTETSISDILSTRFDNKELVVGLVDARSVCLESADDLRLRLGQIADKCQPKALYLTPNTGMEYIGWTYGKEKLDILAKVRRDWHG